ncbi:MAG: Asp-tRNA(Asn)/Glu-tRNA(Gln) amidotransferase subunit GatA [Candidatus Eisenbacteria bacterium]
MEYCELSLAEMGRKLDAGDVAPMELLERHLERIRRLNGTFNAYVSLNEAACRELLERRAGRGARRSNPLAWIPVAVKDNICTAGLRTTCGSRMLERYVPPYDATVVERLRDRDCLILGKTNLDEFGMGSSNETSFFGPCRNPWDAGCVSGGSSGGSAVAVAAGMAAAALGTDTGGSVRQPASLCGIVGYKPTYGLVSRRGLVAYASSLDQIGVLGRAVEDVALVTECISGWDPLDSTSVAREAVKVDAGEAPGSLRVGVPWTWLSKGVHADVVETLRRAIAKLGRAGWVFEEIEMPHASFSIAAYYVVATAEASSNLARYDGVRYGFREDAEDVHTMYCATRSAGFGDEVKRRIMLGTFTLSAGYHDAYYLKAQKVRTLIRQDYLNALGRVDFILVPTSPSPAFRLGEKTDDPLQMYLSDVFTVGVNLAGLPAISLPAGFSEDGLPVGLQLIGAAFEDERLLRAGRAWEQAMEVPRSCPTAVKKALAT